MEVFTTEMTSANSGYTNRFYPELRISYTKQQMFKSIFRVSRLVLVSINNCLNIAIGERENEMSDMSHLSRQLRIREGHRLLRHRERSLKPKAASRLRLLKRRRLLLLSLRIERSVE
ncbi:hypothetical protein C1H46_040049 [Malus baccata]|uniref:Uncharacterized protein n=1 Tax=Malus baccata TaxID=106549 RepID=A0A540KJQ0_MALBA|nr:hypothetical protein C1H46_040049 [Malus baccata]